MLVGTNDSGIHMMRFPVQVADRVSLGLDNRKDAVPQAAVLPAIEARGHARWWTIAGRQVRPGRTGAENPQNAVDHGAVVVARTAAFAALGRTRGWQQGVDACPLPVGKISSIHGL